MGEVLQPFNLLQDPPLDLLQQINVCFALWAPELYAVLQVGSQGNRVEGENHNP